MAAQAAAAVIPLAGRAAKGAAGLISEALTADLAVMRWQYQPRAKRKVKPAPIDMELHLNPMGIGTLAVGAGLALWLMQMRVGIDDKVQLGKWVWPSTNTDASKEMPVAKMGAAPQRMKVDASPPPVRSDYGYDAQGSVAYVVAYTQWKVSNTEFALWQNTRETTGLAVKERKGFLGNGVGTEVSEFSLLTGLGQWIFDPLGLIFKR